MTVREVRVWQARCDICGVESEPAFSQGHPGLPEGWGARTLHDCGMTGYTRRESLCPECFAKHGDPAPTSDDQDAPTRGQKDAPNA